MAEITVKATGLRAIGLQFAGYLFRARRMPRRMTVETDDGLAAAHQQGYISRPRRRSARFIQGVLAGRYFTGAGQAPPRLSTIRRGFRSPARPINATDRMAKDVTDVLVAKFFGGKEESPEQVIRANIDLQFGVGGDPKWERSENFGSLRARRPTLGGRSGRIAAAWRRGRYSGRK